MNNTSVPYPSMEDIVRSPLKYLVYNLDRGKPYPYPARGAGVPIPPIPEEIKLYELVRDQQRVLTFG